MKSDKTIIFIMGPTCVGKSFVAIDLAQKLPIDIISVDASMVYHYMDIGTGKPTCVDLKTVKHYLINVLDPINNYSVGDFCRDSYVIIDRCFNNNRIPCFVGGTLMYFWFLQYGLCIFPKICHLIKTKILTEYKLYGLDFLFSKLKGLNNDVGNKIHKNDKYRIMRNLEKLSIIDLNFHEKSLKYNISDNVKILIFAMIPVDKSKLYLKIKQRIYSMLNDGFIEEVEYLYYRGDLSLSNSSINSIGYRQIWSYLDKKLSLLDVKRNILNTTMLLAKKQIIWLKKWKNKVYYIETNGSGIAKKICAQI